MEKRFINEIRRLRKDAQLSQEKFAAKIGVGRGSIIHWESGRTIPSGEMLLKIADALGKPIYIMPTGKNVV